MKTFDVVSEYAWPGHKQVVLERLCGEDVSGYRISIVLRVPTLDTAKQAYLREIPQKCQNYHSGIIDDYAAKHRIKAPGKRQRREKPTPQGEDTP